MKLILLKVTIERRLGEIRTSDLAFSRLRSRYFFLRLSGIGSVLSLRDRWQPWRKRQLYAEFARDEEADNVIRRATKTRRPFGADQFIDYLEFQLIQPLRLGTPGIPRMRRKLGCP